MNAEIISIGTELLLGEIIDTNSAHIARHLRDIGLNLFFTTTVGDNHERIVEALTIALDRADVIITTGGLGPTVDDMTRQAVAAATGRDLEFRQDLLDQIAERFARFGSRMSANNRQQAYIPGGATPIENPVGTAPCFIVESERGVVISLPGVPREMTFLLDNAVLPYLRNQMGQSSTIKARVLRTAGIGESGVDELIADLMTATNPTVGLAAHIGQTDIRITAKAANETAADSLIASVERTIRSRLGDYIYGVDKETIEEALINQLRRTGLKLAVSSTGLGSTLSERLATIEGSEDALAGTVQYDSVEPLYSALRLDPTTDLETLGAAASAAVAKDHLADIGIATIARPDLTIVSVRLPDKTKTRIYRFGEVDARPAIWASTWGMALAWRWLNGQRR